MLFSIQNLIKVIILSSMISLSIRSPYQILNNNLVEN